MKGSEEGDEVLSAGDEAGELHGRLVGLGARVAEIHATAVSPDRLHLHQSVREATLHWVVEVGAAHVNELPRLLANRGNDAGVAVARAGNGDARRHIEELVAIGIGDPHAEGPIGHQREVAGVTGGHRSIATLDQCQGFGAGQLSAQDGTARHGGS